MVRKVSLEDTGGNMIVAYGEFEEGRYFIGAMNEDLSISDVPFDDWILECGDEDFFERHCTENIMMLEDAVLELWQEILDKLEADGIRKEFIDYWKCDLAMLKQRKERCRNCTHLTKNKYGEFECGRCGRLIHWIKDCDEGLRR